MSRMMLLYTARPISCRIYRQGSKRHQLYSITQFTTIAAIALPFEHCETVFGTVLLLYFSFITFLSGLHSRWVDYRVRQQQLLLLLLYRVSKCPQHPSPITYNVCARYGGGALGVGFEHGISASAEPRGDPSVACKGARIMHLHGAPLLYHQPTFGDNKLHQLRRSNVLSFENYP